MRRRRTRNTGRVGAALATAGVFGAALFFGDSMITPAISVLSAVEGLKVIQPSTASLVVPITVLIILLLFALQRRGTATVGRLFGPVMIVWFAVIGLCGAAGIARQPAILAALSPTHAVGFLAGRFDIAFFTLAAVVLAVTGAEALYADMGHFGRRVITRGWLLLVLPACTLSYFGRGALIASPNARFPASRPPLQSGTEQLLHTSADPQQAIAATPWRDRHTQAENHKTARHQPADTGGSVQPGSDGPHGNRPRTSEAESARGRRVPAFGGAGEPLPDDLLMVLSLPVRVDVCPGWSAGGRAGIGVSGGSFSHGKLSP
ncbi:KUP/HAK/KT family potassium transporter [Micromonospora inyonensis]|uniref:KUP/HAK/KT family potassium transporter n=1 Tax=Micromonospora inyonensis TaxID=47866 RepID=UPI000ACC6741|nr:KUP/HAK/KT family potassium transporter [Micromonospora inyonensis]